MDSIKCPVCGLVLVPNDKRMIYCSIHCRNLLYGRRRRATAKLNPKNKMEVRGTIVETPE